jgi:hypothetical protein
VEIEQALGHNVPASYPTIDTWDAATGTANSIKSVDLNAPTYQSATALSRTLNKYVDSVAEFQGRNWGGLNITSGMIQARSLTVAIPDVSISSSQWDTMAAAYQYGLQQGVSVEYVLVPNFPVPAPQP